MSNKGRIIVTTLADFVVDLFLPTAIFALLTPTALSAAVRLTIGGFFVAAKACAGRVSAPGETEQQTSLKRALAIGALIAIACSAVTAAAVWAGASDSLAIGSGTGLLVTVQALNLARSRRRLDGFALLVLVELAAAIILTSVSNDPRFILIRPSFYTAIAGVYVMTTVWSARPFMMQASKPMATAGDPLRAEAFERAGRESVSFRRSKQAMTAGLAIVLLAEAVLRVLTVLSRPADDLLASSLWSQVPAIGLVVVYFAIVKLVFVPISRREVDAFMPSPRDPLLPAQQTTSASPTQTDP